VRRAQQVFDEQQHTPSDHTAPPPGSSLPPPRAASTDARAARAAAAAHMGDQSPQLVRGASGGFAHIDM